MLNIVLRGVSMRLIAIHGWWGSPPVNVLRQPITYARSACAIRGVIEC